jgi:hypothetical protein
MSVCLITHVAHKQVRVDGEHVDFYRVGHSNNANALNYPPRAFSSFTS